MGVGFFLLGGGCGSLPVNPHRAPSYAIEPDEGPISSEIRHATLESGESGFVLLASGLDAFVARAIIAEQAQRSIDLNTFIFHDDKIGRALLQMILEAADRGVRVRLLFDDIWLGDSDTRFSIVDRHPHIEVRMFNPFGRRVPRFIQYATRFGSVTRRMHNKSMVVDNRMAIVGGRNIGAEYFEAQPEVDFGDLDALMVGDVVAETSATFDRFWNHPLAFPISELVKRNWKESDVARLEERIESSNVRFGESDYVKALDESRLASEMRRGQVRYEIGKAHIIADSPDKLIESRRKTELHLAGAFEELMGEAQEEMIIITPYMIPGPAAVAGFAEMIARGVRVRVLTNSMGSNNHGAAHAHYAKYRKAMLRAGVELYEMKRFISSNQDPADEETKLQVLHAKTYIIDRDRIFIGSLNFDPRSWFENTEMGVVLESPKIGGEIGDWFDYEASDIAYRVSLRENSHGGHELIWHDGEVLLTVEPQTTAWRRFISFLYRVLPIESQL